MCTASAVIHTHQQTQSRQHVHLLVAPRPQTPTHPHHPPTNHQVFCELVKGLGESLVSGMVPGSSVAFAARKDALDNPQTLSYASKSEGMFVRESLIFRWVREGGWGGVEGGW